MITIGELLKKSWDYVQKNNPRIERWELELLFSELLHLQRLDLYTRYDTPLVEDELKPIRAAFQRLLRDEPVAYILGYTYFYGMKIQVSPAVLIPRPETELLVESVLKRIEKAEMKKLLILDVCTGSGCIGAVMQKNLPMARVISSDLSQAALEVAKRNAQSLDLPVEFIRCDLFADLPLEEADIILINPPYISQSEYSALSPSVKNFEPEEALVGGRLGTEYYDRILMELSKKAKKGALVGLEIGADQYSYFGSTQYNYSFEYIRDYGGHVRHVLFSI